MINSGDTNFMKTEVVSSDEEMKTFSVFWKDYSDDKGVLIEYKVETNPSSIVDDFLLLILCKLNAKLKESRSHYLLSNNKELFSLMIAKKNGEPKTDYPGNF